MLSMLRSRGKIVIALILIVLAVIMYFITQEKHIDSVEKQMFDTLNYDKRDYDLMIAYYNSDTTFKKTLHENIEMGDSSSIVVKQLLQTPYHLRYKSGLKESDINAMIYAYHASKNVLDKFGDIENQLKKLKEANAPKSADDSAIQRHLDSLMNLARERKLEKPSN